MEDRGQRINSLKSASDIPRHPVVFTVVKILKSFTNARHSSEEAATGRDILHGLQRMLSKKELPIVQERRMGDRFLDWVAILD